MFRRLSVASLLALLAGCRNSMPTSPAVPSLSEPHVVSGIASETVDGVTRPLARTQVHLFISGTCPGPPGCRVESGRQPFYTDDSGRYTAHVPTSRVFVSANAPGLQPCVASAAIDKDTTIDVQVVPPGRLPVPPLAARPMITGFVYETTPQGRSPLRGVDVWLEVGFDGYFVAGNQTDDAGRFFLCRVDAPVLMYVYLSGYQRVAAQSIPGNGDMSFEIELRR